ncbi:magnesium transporter CorA family protein [Parahaliea aestuarii]|uniref:Magnesium transporter CorA family protein n=1 Tax=Parahaliea aestuarii TaxID=1852021 RepID=A0A5C8ZXR5_9GAMM|nr:magnesium transporter CorA family protein [Parahaliea aestuarii]TXS93266.1 magnesium transporter CorA family protein [Parahaliea aestuarii]
MIRAKLLSAQGEQRSGALELVEEWRASDGAFMWLDIEGEVTSDIRALLVSLGCSELAITDSVRLRHPPKIEAFSDNTFVLFRGIARIDDDLNLTPQQVGLWVGDNYLISVHRGLSVSINHFWQEPAENASLANPAELALRLLHFASGRYLDKILEFEDTLGELEDALLTGHSDSVMRELVGYRSRLRKLRRIFNYHHQMTTQLLHDGTPHLGCGDHDEANHHLRRDLYDRCERLFSLCNMYYEICGDLVEGYISLTSHQLNNTMKVLTIITAIFVPLGFLAGLYGMNFEHMPELHFRYGYFFILFLMISIAGGMLWLFRRIRWL